jgi:hypothetical protein
MPHFLTCETSHKFFEDPQNDKKKIKDSETSKYKNKKTQIVLKTHKMTRRQIENFKTSK